MSLESFQAPICGVPICEPASGVTRSLPVVEGKGKGIAINEHIAQSLLGLHKPKKKSIADQYIFQRRTLVIKEASTGPSAQPEEDTYANVVRYTQSPTDAETGADTEKSHSEADTEILDVAEEQGEGVSNTVDLKERTDELDKGQAVSDPGNTLESRPPPDEDQAGSDPGQTHVALAGPNPVPMHEEFIAIFYSKVYESLKHTIEEHVFLENPPSSSRTLSSMKNLDGAFTVGDQFIDDKSPEDEPGKATRDTEVESMVTVPIHQASSSVPFMSVPVIDFSPLKPVSSPIQAPTITATTITTLLLPPPPPQQSTTDPELASRISALEKRRADLKQKTLNQDKTIQALGYRVYTLENHELYLKIDKQVNEVVKEAVHDALQAPLLDRFRELSEVQMKESLRDRMFESGSYKSHSDHSSLYQALEVSIDRDNGEEFIEEEAKSRKRRHDDQNPPLPPPKGLD
ncbi:hypothetical protein Tco_0959020 [Tanacetum coccineum]